MVKSVSTNSPAAGMVREGDIILEVNRRTVSSVEEFRAAVKTSSRVLLRIARENAQIYVAFDNR
jgi:S1-C subfamily serine protease